MALTMAATKLLRCPTCNHTAPAPPQSGVILQITLPGSTRILQRCPVCEKLKFQIVERGGARPHESAGADSPGAREADRELTLQELAAYVSEKTMAIETAEAIAASPASEVRKREIAAWVAEGTLDPVEAGRLLAL